MYELIIVGGGPAGTAAGVYAARKRIKTLLITESFGGQSTDSADIQNWIGIISMSGVELAERLEKHLKAYADDVLEIKSRVKVTKISQLKKAGEEGGPLFEVETDDGKKYQSRLIIFALGSRRRKLQVKGAEQFEHKGIVYCASCLAPGQDVVANNSLEKIDKIGISHNVLTIDGTFQRINQIMSRDYDGEMINIKTRFFTEPVSITSNHPVLKTRIVKGNSANNWRDFKIEKPDWALAGDLTENDVLLYPIIRKTKDVEKIIVSDILDVEVVNGKAKNKMETHTAHRIPNEIPVSNDFMRLAGYYISEGSVNLRGMNFYFSKEEKGYINDTKKIFEGIFGLKATLKTTNSVTAVMTSAKIVRDLFHLLFGRYANNKQIPHWMMFLSKEKQIELVKGIYRGNGGMRDKDFCIVTSSRTLAYQLRDLLLRLGVLPSIQVKPKDKINKYPAVINGREIRFNYDKYHVVIGGPSLERMSEILGVHHPKLNKRKRVCRQALIKDNFVYLPIREITKVRYKGPVYNLAVNKNNTYVARNFIVHNCDAPLFRDRDVAVVGGGNAGLEAAEQLIAYAKTIHIFEIGQEFRADKLTQDRVFKNPKVMPHTNAEVFEIKGDNMVSGLAWKDKNTGKIQEIPVQGVFVEIGSIPNTELLKGLVEMNKYGEIVIDHKTSRSSVEGIWAAGDATDQPYKQNNISMGDAVKALEDAYLYLQKLK